MDALDAIEPSTRSLTASLKIGDFDNDTLDESLAALDKVLVWVSNPIDFLAAKIRVSETVSLEDELHRWLGSAEHVRQRLSSAREKMLLVDPQEACLNRKAFVKAYKLHFGRTFGGKLPNVDSQTTDVASLLAESYIKDDRAVGEAFEELTACSIPLCNKPASRVSHRDRIAQALDSYTLQRREFADQILNQHNLLSSYMESASESAAISAALSSETEQMRQQIQALSDELETYRQFAENVGLDLQSCRAELAISEKSVAAARSENKLLQASSLNTKQSLSAKIDALGRDLAKATASAETSKQQLQIVEAELKEFLKTNLNAAQIKKMAIKLKETEAMAKDSAEKYEAKRANSIRALEQLSEENTKFKVLLNDKDLAIQSLSEVVKNVNILAEQKTRDHAVSTVELEQKLLESDKEFNSVSSMYSDCIKRLNEVLVQLDSERTAHALTQASVITHAEELQTLQAYVSAQSEELRLLMISQTDGEVPTQKNSSNIGDGLTKALVLRGAAVDEMPHKHMNFILTDLVCQSRKFPELRVRLVNHSGSFGLVIFGVDGSPQSVLQNWGSDGTENGVSFAIIHPSHQNSKSKIESMPTSDWLLVNEIAKTLYEGFFDEENGLRTIISEPVAPHWSVAAARVFQQFNLIKPSLRYDAYSPKIIATPDTSEHKVVISFANAHFDGSLLPDLHAHWSIGEVISLELKLSKITYDMPPLSNWAVEENGVWKNAFVIKLQSSGLEVDKKVWRSMSREDLLLISDLARNLSTVIVESESMQVAPSIKKQILKTADRFCKKANVYMLNHGKIVKQSRSILGVRIPL